VLPCLLVALDVTLDDTLRLYQPQGCPALFVALLQTSRVQPQPCCTNTTNSTPSPVLPVVAVHQGVCLQGCFGVQEPVTAVFDWVTHSLRDPGLTYELITPSRAPLAASGTVSSADLAGAVLNFRALAHHQHGYLVDAAGRQQPFLSDAQLALARAD